MNDRYQLRGVRIGAVIAVGNIYVRYVTGGAAIGTPKPSYLTGTYPSGDIQQVP